MTMDTELIEEYLTRISERYTPDELFEILDLSMDQFIDAFYDQLIENSFLQTELGIQESE